MIPPAEPPAGAPIGVLAAPVQGATQSPESSGDFLTGTIVPKSPEIPPAEATITGEIPRRVPPPVPPAEPAPAVSSGGTTVVGLASRPSAAPSEHPADPAPSFSVPEPAPAEPSATEPPAEAEAPTPSRSARHGARRRRRAPLYVALALVPALAIAALAYAVLTDDGPPPAAAAPTVTATVTASAPQPTETPASSGIPSVDTADTDPEPLTMGEVFPTRKVTLDGRDYALDRKSLNLRCDYAAAGAMAKSLIRNDCQMVVRSTFVSGNGKTGITVGVVAMPTKRVAITVQKGGSPARKGEWFTGLPGKRTKQLGASGGYAASTTYGRYILYVYVRHLEGRKPAKADLAFAKVATAFIGYVGAPLHER
ncbi:hypothetical protein GCM10022221_12150 [Actinocorallia aurea]